MTKYAVDKVLWQIARDTAAEHAYKTDREAFLSGRELTEAEHAALMAFDVRTMFQAGIHPFLIYMSSLRVKGPWSFKFMDDYVAELKGLEFTDVRT